MRVAFASHEARQEPDHPNIHPALFLASLAQGTSIIHVAASPSFSAFPYRVFALSFLSTLCQY